MYGEIVNTGNFSMSSIYGHPINIKRISGIGWHLEYRIIDKLI